MFYAKNDNNSLFLINSKYYLWKSSPYLKYIFLTNKHSFFFNSFNVFLLSNYSFLVQNFFRNFLITNLIISKKTITFKKWKKINQYRRFFILKTFSLKYNFRFNKYFSFIKSLKSFKNFKNFKNFSLILPLFLKTYRNKLLTNWSFLIGLSFSPYLFDLHFKKKWIRRSISFTVFKNTLYFHRNLKKKKKKTIGKIFKKIFANNYFYFRKNKFTYNNLLLLFKNNSSKLKLSSNDWFLSKPYLFLNNFESSRFFNNYNNFFLINLFKIYSKMFTSFKKFNYNFRARNTNDLFFKKFYSIKNTLVAKRTPQIYLPFNAISNYFSFFFFKNEFYNALKFYKKIKKIKKSARMAFFYKIIFKTKLIKRNRLFSSLKLFPLKKKHLRPNRRLKKTFLLNTLHSLKLIYKKVNLSWYKKHFLLNNTKFKIILKNFFYTNFKFLFLNYSFKNLFKKKLTLNSSLFLKPSLELGDSNINNISKRPIFYTKDKLSFLSSRYGFLFISNFSTFFLHNFRNSYSLKKNLYAFSYKNEIHKFIMKRYIKLNFMTTPKFNDYSSSNVFNYSLNSPFSLSPSFIFKQLSTNIRNEAFFLVEENVFDFENWNYFSDQIVATRNSLNDEVNLNIRRIRFKPGYMTLWREARNMLKNTLSLTFRYQYKLTKYLSKYSKFVKFKTFLVAEMSLLNLLLRSRFFNDNNLGLIFIRNNLVYVNGVICANPNFQLFVGDFVQLIISLKYYILYRWFLNLSLKKKNRLKNVFKKKMSISLESDEKKRSNSLPKWILFSKNSFDDISKFLEVDFFTLSFFILYEPFLWSDINAYNILDNKFGVINLYNWKYIT